MRKLLQFSGIFFLLVFVDQATKHFAYSNAGGFLNSFRPVFGYQLFPNKDIAFSIHIPTVLMWVMYVTLLLALVVWFMKLKNKTFAASFAITLILSGALSNIFDRLALGYVRDFIFVFWGNVFNLADLFIIAGIFLLLFKDDTQKKADTQKAG